MLDDLSDQPIGFLYSKKGDQKKLNKSRSRVTLGRRRINWKNPTPEDIAAGLSDEQCSALIDLRPDNTRGPHKTPLDQSVPGWRDKLIVSRGYGEPVVLTSLGSQVRAIIVSEKDRP